MGVTFSKSGPNCGCFEVQPGSVTELSASPGTINQGYANKERIDALKNNSLWQGLVQQPIRVTSGDDLCWRGGVVKGDFNTATTWDDMHNTEAFQIRNDMRRFTLEHFRAHNYGDGFQVNPSVLGRNLDGFKLRGCRFNWMRDDGFQNDFGMQGLIDDCFFDKAYVGYSSRPFNEFVGNNSNKVVTIRDCIWHLEDMPTGFAGPGHGRMWKMDNAAQLGWPGFPRDPKLRLINVLIYVPTIHNCCGDFYIPPADRLYNGTSENCMVVWTNGQSFPDTISPGWTVHTASSTPFDDRKAQWMASHPLVNQEPDFAIPV